MRSPNRLANLLDPRELAGLSEDDLLGVLAATERAGRRVDALRVLTAGEVAEQSRNELGKCGLAARKGCRSSAELIERVTQVSGETARKRIKTGRAVRARLSLAGERLPAEFNRGRQCAHRGDHRPGQRPCDHPRADHPDPSGR